MKKLMIGICMLVLISACSSDSKTKKKLDDNEKQVICTLEDNEQSGVEVTYTYDDEKKITKIHNVSYLQFSQEELETTSLNDYYEQINSQYTAAEGESGVEIKITKDDEKQRIQMDVTINLALYNLEDDILNITNDGEMENVDDTVGLYEAMGVYHCGKVK